MNKNIIKLAIAGIMISGSCTMLHASDYYSSVSDEPISQSSLREKLTLIEDHIARLEGSEGLHEAEQILDDAKSKLRELENRLGGIKVFFDHTKKIGDEWTDVLGFKHKKSYKESEECTNFYGTVHIIWPGQWVEGDGNLHWKTSDGLTQWTDDNYTLHWIGSDGHEYEVPNGEYNFTTKDGKLASIADGSWYELIDQDGNHVGWDELSYERYRVKSKYTNIKSGDSWTDSFGFRHYMMYGTEYCDIPDSSGGNQPNQIPDNNWIDGKDGLLHWKYPGMQDEFILKPDGLHWVDKDGIEHWTDLDNNHHWKDSDGVEYSMELRYLQDGEAYIGVDGEFVDPEGNVIPWKDVKDEKYRVK